MTPTIQSLGIDRLPVADRLRLMNDIWDTLPPAEIPIPEWHWEEIERRLADDTPTIVHSDPERMGGTPVFVGTRVPVKTLFDYLNAGQPLDEFLDDFPTVEREQAVATLGLAQRILTAHAYSAR